MKGLPRRIAEFMARCSILNHERAMRRFLDYRA